jgi:lipoate-protein ligase A
MALDEFLFRTLPDKPGTVVRFYRWERPTASLGYGQKAEKVVDLAYCRSHGIDVVRRPTGGKLVLHNREVTYSVASSDAERFTPTVAGSYKLISRGLVRGLERMGLRPTLSGQAPPSYARGTMPCFSHPAQDEVELDGRKIIGSAQKRVGGKFVQHGSIPLAADEELLQAVSFRQGGPGGIRMTSLSEALGREVGFDEAAGVFAAGLAEFFGVEFEPLILDSSEAEAVRLLRVRKYESPAWTLQGREPA